MQPYFGEDKSKLHYMHTDSFIFSLKPTNGPTEDLKNFKEDFDCSDLDLAHELYSEDNEKVIEEKKHKTAPELFLGGAVFLRSKSNSSKNIRPKDSDTRHKKYMIKLRTLLEIIENVQKKGNVKMVLFF